jgi:hypothetical protein
MKRSLPAVVLFICLITFDSSAQNPAFVPGQTYFGRNNYIEYIAGNSPYIVSAPHGGILTPGEIPDRTGNVETVRDTNTEELARAISAAIFAREGKYPHIIICRLSRKKIDPNRELEEAAQGNPYAIQAWKEFQSFIDTAKQAIIRDFGKGFYVDIHGHGHTIQRLELGYLLSSASLALSDNSLDAASFYRNSSSIRTMVPLSGMSFSQLLRGPKSLGSLFESRGFPSVPSAAQPNPGNDLYFSGGYNTARHGSSGGGAISGVQIECNMTGVRDTEESRARFAQAFAEAIDAYWSVTKPPVFVADEASSPDRFVLMQNYPNPFNPTTSFEFKVSSFEFVSLKVLDVLGREVATLVNDYRQPGVYTVRWNASGLPSGVYYYRMHHNGSAETKKMLLAK